MLNIAESVPPPELISSIPGILELDKTGIPSDSAIPELSQTRIAGNSVQFRIALIPGIPYGNYFPPSPSCMLLRLKIILWDKSAIPVRNSENCYQFPNSHRFRFDSIPELRNRTKFRFCPVPEFPELRESIPGAELIPQCSTLRNRMTAHNLR